MEPATPDQPPAVSPRPVRRLLRLMLYICIGLIVAFVGLVLQIGLEGVIGLNAHHLGADPRAGVHDVVYMVLRGTAYLLISGPIAWAIYRLATPRRRRRYWIALGIGTALLISPAGFGVMVFGALLVIYLFGIPIGG